jgi:hypothetical protein
VAAHLSSFNELRTDYQISPFLQQILTHSLFTETLWGTSWPEMQLPN